jgi:hypothetical protein
VSHPGNWLPNGNASYEECLWSELIASLYGTHALVDFFAQRALHPTEPVLTTYDQVLRSRGSSLASVCDALGVWSYFSGANAPNRPVGFGEAHLFPTPPLTGTFALEETAVSATLSGMSTHYLLATPAGRTGHAVVSFAGDRQRPLAAHVTILTRSSLRPIWTMPLSASNTGTFEVPFVWDEIVFLVVGVTNLGAPGSASSYVAAVGDPNAVGVNAFSSSGTLSLEPNRPNPFRNTTAITFTIPSTDHVRLAVYDVAGRLVRRHVDERRMPAGTHERDWNGFDESGRPAAPGVYYYRLQTSSDSASRKMLLLR